MDLAPAVMAQLVRLGARIARRRFRREAAEIDTIAGPKKLPEPLERFGNDVTWPDLPFRAADDDYPRGVSFGLNSVVDDYTRKKEGVPVVSIGEDATQFMYFVRLDDPNPADPAVYRVDHEGDGDLSSGHGTALSSFLADLVQDDPADGAAEFPLLLTAAPPPDALRPVTRTGGRPLAPPGFAWPTCKLCANPMQFLAQIALRDVDPEFPDRLLLAFACVCADAREGGAWEVPDAGANAVVCVERSGLVLHDPPGPNPPVIRPIDGVACVRFNVDRNAEHGVESYAKARSAFEARDVLGHVRAPLSVVSTRQFPITGPYYPRLKCPACVRRGFCAATGEHFDIPFDYELRFVARLEPGRHPEADRGLGPASAFTFVCPECWTRGAMFGAREVP